LILRNNPRRFSHKYADNVTVTDKDLTCCTSLVEEIGQLERAVVGGQVLREALQKEPKGEEERKTV
jgi:hypothetical protein